MLEAQFSCGGDFKKILEAINDVTSEVKFECESDGIYVQAMDQAKVALVNLCINSSGLLYYKCDANMSVGIFVPALLKLMKCSDNDDVLTFRVRDDESEAELQFESKKIGSYLTVISKLINLDVEKLILPVNLTYPCVAKLSSGKLARIIHDLSQIGDNISIQRINKDIILESIGGISGSAKIRLKTIQSSDYEDRIEININEVFSPVVYNARYLSSFMKAAKLSPTVTLKISDQIPLLIEYQLLKSSGYIQFYLNFLVD